MPVSRRLREQEKKKSIWKHRFTVKTPEQEPQTVIKFDHRTLRQSPTIQRHHLEHRATPAPEVTMPPKIVKNVAPQKTVTKPTPPLIIPFKPPFTSRYSRKQWVEFLSQLPAGMNEPPVMDVGEEKVTVFSAYEPSKHYIIKEHFEAISKLQINDGSEIFITIDNHAAPIRWSKEGVTKDGQLARRERVAEVENVGRQRAIENGSDYLMIAECDLLPPPDAYRRLRTLIVNYGADIVFLPYTWHWMNLKRGPGNIYSPVLAWRGKYPNMTMITLRDFLSEPYPAEVLTCGLGCAMFKRTVFEKQPFELDQYGIWCTNGVLAKRVKEENLKVLGDNRLFVQHVCCKHCYTRKTGNYPEKVDVKEAISEFLEGRNVVVKEI